MLWGFQQQRCPLLSSDRALHAQPFDFEPFLLGVSATRSPAALNAARIRRTSSSARHSREPLVRRSAV